jgi:MFS family permease
MLTALVCLKVMRVTDRLPADEQVRGTRARWERITPLLRHSAYRAALAASAISFLTVSAYQTLVPVHWVKLAHGTEAGSGLPFAASGLAALLVVWHAGSLADRRGRRFALIPSLIVLVGTTAALGFTFSTIGIMVLMTVQGFAGGYARPGPASIVADVAPPDIRGVAVSGQRIAADLGAVIGPIIAGVLADYVSYRAAYLAIALCCLGALYAAVRAEETAPAMRAEP